MTARAKVRTIEEERAYHRGMSRMLAERGYEHLARSHGLAAEEYLPEEERMRNLAACRQWDPEECASLCEMRDMVRAAA